MTEQDSVESSAPREEQIIEVWTEWLAFLLKNTGMSQRAYAQRAGVDPSTLSRYCKGTTLPVEAFVERLLADQQSPLTADVRAQVRQQWEAALQAGSRHEFEKHRLRVSERRAQLEIDKLEEIVQRLEKSLGEKEDECEQLTRRLEQIQQAGAHQHGQYWARRDEIRVLENRRAELQYAQHLLARELAHAHQTRAQWQHYHRDMTEQLTALERLARSDLPMEIPRQPSAGEAEGGAAWPGQDKLVEPEAGAVQKARRGRHARADGTAAKPLLTDDGSGARSRTHGGRHARQAEEPHEPLASSPTAGPAGDVHQDDAFAAAVLEELPHVPGDRAAQAGKVPHRDPAPESLALRAVNHALQQGHPVPLPSLEVQGGGSVMAFSPKKDTLATLGAGVVRLWDPATRQPLRQFLTERHSDVVALTFSSEGGLFVASAKSRTVRLWTEMSNNLRSGDNLPERRSKVATLKFSPDCSVLATGSKHGMVRLWDTHTCQAMEQPVARYYRPVTAVAFSPDGLLLAVGTKDGTVQVWDTKTRKAICQPITGYIRSVSILDFSPDGRLLATADTAGTIRFWDATTCQPTGDPLTAGPYLQTMAFSPVSSHLVTGTLQGSILIWDPVTGCAVGPPLTHSDEPVYGLAFSRYGDLLAAGFRSGTIKMWAINDH
ncbi:helix-turn-helix domain-containing protein [Streptomyces sp. NPDC055210]